jgi:hypothetical protein
MIPFVIATAVWLLLPWLVRPNAPRRRLRGFVWGSLAIALGGLTIYFLLVEDVLAWASGRDHLLENRELAAALLRFYWFRLSDVAVPLGLALGGVSGIVVLGQARPRAGRVALGLAILGAAAHFGPLAWQRIRPTVPPAVKAGQPNPWRYCEIHQTGINWHRDVLLERTRQFDKVANYQDWRDVCAWIARDQSENGIPRNACFLTPRESQTFKWYTGHPEVANWKENPQDAQGLNDWWTRMGNVYLRTRVVQGLVWWGSLAQLGAEEGEQQLVDRGAMFGADYVLTVSEPRLELPVMYRNDSYVIYRLKE